MAHGVPSQSLLGRVDVVAVVDEASHSFNSHATLVGVDEALHGCFSHAGLVGVVRTSETSVPVVAWSVAVVRVHVSIVGGPENVAPEVVAPVERQVCKERKEKDNAQGEEPYHESKS